ncbi:MAG: cytochrome c3 family protein [Nitrospirae bacterium]|nr:cytochrome c3 family protein [Nitrospirota bacterium]
MSYVKKLTGLVYCHNMKQMLRFFIGTIIIYFLFIDTQPANSGAYLQSSHGDSTYGVKRNASGFPSGYPKGLCAHCHEQHANIDGSEPAPSDGGPSLFELFSDNHIAQTENFCYQCHKESGSYQSGGMVNRSYSYRAGGWTADSVNDILESFNYGSPDSSHYLDDIVTFISGKWGYTANSNPCTACHNPHSAQGDPPNMPNGPKNTSTTRGWPVSRPSLHSKDNNTWGLWGDVSGERMSIFTYQAPYRFNSSTNYEPDGSTTVYDGSNLTDFVSFCTDCHNDSNTIYSTPLFRDSNKFNWNTEQHGGGVASYGCSDILPPYQEAQCGSYVLSCTDCHEPHGSPNIFLIRKEVNGDEVTVDAGNAPGPDERENTEWIFLCSRCHDGLSIPDGRHTHPFFVPPQVSGCSSLQCHEAGDYYRVCTECHNHGNQDIDGTPFGEPLL